MTRAHTITAGLVSGVRRARWNAVAEFALALVVVVGGAAAVLIFTGALTAEGFTAKPPPAPLSATDASPSGGAVEVSLETFDPIESGFATSLSTRVDIDDVVIVDRERPVLVPLPPRQGGTGGGQYLPPPDPPPPSEVRMCNRVLPDCGW